MINNIDWDKILDEFADVTCCDFDCTPETVLGAVSVAIDNEMASPPVWINVDPDGRFRGLYKSKEAAIDDLRYGEKPIHWKG